MTLIVASVCSDIGLKICNIKTSNDTKSFGGFFKLPIIELSDQILVLYKGKMKWMFHKNLTKGHRFHGHGQQPFGGRPEASRPNKFLVLIDNEETVH